MTKKSWYFVELCSHITDQKASDNFPEKKLKLKIKAGKNSPAGYELKQSKILIIQIGYTVKIVLTRNKGENKTLKNALLEKSISTKERIFIMKIRSCPNVPQPVIVVIPFCAFRTMTYIDTTFQVELVEEWG